MNSENNSFTTEEIDVLNREVWEIMQRQNVLLALGLQSRTPSPLLPSPLSSSTTKPLEENNFYYTGTVWKPVAAEKE